MTTPPNVPRPARPLRRSRSQKVLGGVCGGIAEYTGIDVTLIRVLLVVAVVFAGTGLLAYVLAWLLIPLEGESISVAERLWSRR